MKGVPEAWQGTGAARPGAIFRGAEKNEARTCDTRKLTYRPPPSIGQRSQILNLECTMLF